MKDQRTQSIFVALWYREKWKTNVILKPRGSNENIANDVHISIVFYSLAAASQDCVTGKCS